MKALIPSTNRQDVLRDQWAIPSIDQIMVEERAAAFGKRSIKTSAKLAGLKLAISMMDLTTLEGKDTPGKVAFLCRKAMQPADPQIRRAVLRRRLRLSESGSRGEEISRRLGRESRVRRHGVPERIDAVAHETPGSAKRSGDGADEIDMVIDRGVFLAGNTIASPTRSPRRRKHAAPRI